MPIIELERVSVNGRIKCMNVFFGNFGDIYKEFDFDMVVNMVLC